MTDATTRRARRSAAVALAALAIAGGITGIRGRAGAQAAPPTDHGLKPAATAHEPGPASNPRIAVPSYIETNKTTTWGRVLDTPAHVGIVVANANSGPGTAVDPGWQAIIANAKRAGKRVLAYVDTGYLGSRPAWNDKYGIHRDLPTWVRHIEADIARWYALYGKENIDGFFFDDGDDKCGPPGAPNAHADAYAGINRHVKAGDADALTVLNLGVNPPPCLAPAADIIVSREATVEQYLDQDFWGVWWPNLNPRPQQFWHIIHGVPEARLQAVLDKARARGAGWVYVTDDTDGENPLTAKNKRDDLGREVRQTVVDPVTGQSREVPVPDPNPYNDLPTYWSREVQALGR